MATYINGFGGDITFGASPATLSVTDWEMMVNGEALDTTNTGDSGWESNILGAKSFEGSCKAFWDSTAVPTGSANYKAGERGTGTFKVGSSGKTYVGTIQITQTKIANSAKGVVGFDITFKGSGALTQAS